MRFGFLFAGIPEKFILQNGASGEDFNPPTIGRLSYRKVEALLRVGLVVQLEVPPLARVVAEAGGSHRVKEQRAVRLRPGRDGFAGGGADWIETVEA